MKTKKLVIYADEQEQSICTDQNFVECVEYMMNFREEEEIAAIMRIIKALCRLKDIWFGVD